MKRAWVSLALSFVLACALTWAQQPGSGSSPALAYEDGRIENNTYTNECFGFSLTIPDGWEPQLIGTDGKAKHLTQGQLMLLNIGREKKGPPSPEVVLIAIDANGSAVAAQQAVSRMVRAQVDGGQLRGEMVRETYAVEYGSRLFYRVDYKETVNGSTIYRAFIFTKFRGFFLGASLGSDSAGELEIAADLLQGLAFHEDKRNPQCVMNGDASPSTGGIVGGIISSKPIASQSNSGLPMRVRVSSGVSTGLLVTKVPPQYPDDAKHARVQGQVVLQALIDKNGDVEKLTLISGHPLLASAAIEAVKQWKYKPYLLNGQPVAVETQIVVSFQLSGQ
jgi:TonB family protein